VFCAEADNTYLVKPIMATEEDEEWAGNPVILKKIYPSAPRETYDKTIETLDTKIHELQQQKRELEEELRKSKQDETERKKRIMVNAALERIDDFLAGKFTHIVFGDYDVKIETFVEALMYKNNDYDKVPTEFRLLSLYGRSKGDLAWKLSYYGDGSGSSNQVYPCFSLEHAQAVAKQLIEEKYNQWRSEPKRYHVHPAFRSAVNLGLDIPDDVEKEIKESSIIGAQDWRDTKKKEYLEAEDKLHNAINQSVVEFAKGKK
jgi:molybdopterin converting factor small subunit